MADSSFHTRTTIPDFASVDKPVPMPSKIGPYKVESLFCKGGMSILYLGHHKDDKIPLVLKVLSPRLLKYKEMKGRFLKEAEIISLTNHPNIVKLYGQGKWGGGLYIAMEFIQGVSLKQFIKTKSLSQKSALEIILQVAYALCHLHSHNVIHRDLKPENILISESGEIKVIDFGISQLKKENTNTMVIGTPAYMSPEQKNDPKSVSFSSDIYSLGLITYELVCGELSSEEVDLEKLPKGLRDTIQKMIHKDPSQRYCNIVDFITEISKHIKSLDRSDNEEHPLKSFSQDQKLFLPKQINFPHLDIGIAFKELPFSGMYLDFFPLPQNRYLMVFFEPIDIGVNSYFYTGVIRGMLQMIVEEIRRADTHPVKLLNRLNRVVIKDSFHTKFAAVFLILNPNKDLLSFISLGHNNLLHVSEGSEKAKIIMTPNPPIATEKDITFLETADLWNPGDAIYLQSLSFYDTENAETIIQEKISSCSGIRAKNQAEQILESTLSKNRSSASICLIRIF